VIHQLEEPVSPDPLQWMWHHRTCETGLIISLDSDRDARISHDHEELRHVLATHCSISQICGFHMSMRCAELDVRKSDSQSARSLATIAAAAFAQPDVIFRRFGHSFPAIPFSFDAAQDPKNDHTLVWHGEKQAVVSYIRVPLEKIDHNPSRPGASTVRQCTHIVATECDCRILT
jgi:hypothetical protein